MLATISSLIETFVSFFVKIFAIGYILGRIIIHICSTITDVTVSIAWIIASYAVVFYEDVKIFMLDIEYQYGHIIKMLNNGVNNSLNDLSKLALAILSSIEWISEQTKVETSKLYNGSINLLVRSAVGLRNWIVLIGNSAWMLLMCIPNLALAFSVILMKCISSVWAAITDSTMVIMATIPDYIRGIVSFISSVPLQSLCGLIVIHLLIRYRWRVYSLVRLISREFLRIVINIGHQILIGYENVIYFLAPIRNYTPNIRRLNFIQSDYANPVATNSTKTNDNFNACVICQDKLKSIVLMPCRHLCLCLDCYKQLKRYRRECPMCRQPYEHSIQVYA